MIRSRCLAAVVAFSLVFIVATSSGVSAFSIETTETNFLLDPQVQISAYGWQLEDATKALSISNPLLLQYLQLYNDSDTLVDLRDWKVFVQDPLGARTEVVFSIEFSGWIQPHKHVIASFGDAVSGATLHIAKMALPSLTQSVKSKFVVAPSIAGTYREVDYELKSTSVFWQRNMSSTGLGYVSTFTGAATSPTQLADDGLYAVPEPPALIIEEIYPYSSECPPNDTAVLCGDYIKLQVATNDQDMSQYVLRTDSSSSSRTTSNTFYLSDYPIQENGYVIVAFDEDAKRMSLTNSGGYVWIEDLYGKKLYETTITQYDAALTEHQGWSWIRDSDNVWKWTSTPQPNSSNKLTIPDVESTEVCPAGKYLNPETNRCRTIEEAVNALAACPEGQERNPITNRCRSKVLAAVVTLTPCGEGQERNPLTNRCRSIASAVAELMPCDEGYERNPATNRCRKVLAATTAASGAGASNSSAAVEPAQTSSSWGWALATVALCGAVGYGLYEWRHEIARGVRSVTSKVSRK